MNRKILEAIFAGAIPGMFWGGALTPLQLWPSSYLDWILGAILGAIGAVIVWRKGIPAKWILVGCIFLLVIAGVRTGGYGVLLGSVALIFTWNWVIRECMKEDILRELAARTGLTYEPGFLEPGRVIGTYRGHLSTVVFYEEVDRWEGERTTYIRIVRSGREHKYTWGLRLLQGVGRNVKYLQSLLDPAERSGRGSRAGGRKKGDR